MAKAANYVEKKIKIKLKDSLLLKAWGKILGISGRFRPFTKIHRFGDCSLSK